MDPIRKYRVFFINPNGSTCGPYEVRAKYREEAIGSARNKAYQRRNYISPNARVEVSSEEGGSKKKSNPRYYKSKLKQIRKNILG